MLIHNFNIGKRTIFGIFKSFFNCFRHFAERNIAPYMINHPTLQIINNAYTNHLQMLKIDVILYSSCG